MSGAARLEAPAKLNLELRVVGRRDDGYHLLESVVVLLELGDRLLLLPGCSGLRVEGPAAADVPVDASNLAWRGLIAGFGGEPEGACLALNKRIPPAAGLGGGSSDAAAAWRLARWSRGLPDDAESSDLADLAAIGADLPFFAARAAAARVTGIGERVEVLPARPLEVVLVHPPFLLSTAAVFAELRAHEWGRLPNDLLAPARRLRQEIDDLMALVVAAGGDPRLTGSGPTVFATTDDPERAEAIAGRLGRAGLHTSVTRTRLAAASINPINQEE